jgi:hypothetical protein
MREFSSLSGPWVGQSIQDGLRITEAIMLEIRGNSFSGSGTDKDGHFELNGEHDPEDGMVQMTRCYLKAPMSPSQVGYPFVYIGKWNGDFIEGRWMMSTQPQIGGPFEMWPESEEEALAVEKAAEEHVFALPVPLQR